MFKLEQLAELFVYFVDIEIMVYLSIVFHWDIYSDLIIDEYWKIY